MMISAFQQGQMFMTLRPSGLDDDNDADEDHEDAAADGCGDVNGDFYHYAEMHCLPMPHPFQLDQFGSLRHVCKPRPSGFFSLTEPAQALVVVEDIQTKHVSRIIFKGLRFGGRSAGLRKGNQGNSPQFRLGP